MELLRHDGKAMGKLPNLCIQRCNYNVLNAFVDLASNWNIERRRLAGAM